MSTYNNPVNIQKPDAIFFDWDGTLVNTIPTLRNAHNHVRVSLGFPEWTETEFWSNLKHSSKDLYPKIYGDQVERAFDTLFAFMDENHLVGIEKIKGTDRLIAILETLDIPMGILSNKKHPYLEREINHYGWADLFPIQYGSGVLETDKPSADPLLHLCKEAGITQGIENVWYVGDTVTDMLTAKNAGCKSILLADDINRADLESEFTPYLSLDDCGQLADIIENSFTAEQKSGLA